MEIEKELARKLQSTAPQENETNLILRKIPFLKLYIEERIIKIKKKCLIAQFIRRKKKGKKIAVKVNCLDPHKKRNT